MYGYGWGEKTTIYVIYLYIDLHMMLYIFFISPFVSERKKSIGKNFGIALLHCSYV